MFIILPAQCWKKRYIHSCSEKYKGIDARGDQDHAAKVDRA